MPDNTFNVGDRIRCLEVDGNVYITAGKEYVARDGTTANRVWITDDVGDRGHYPADLFELVNSPAPAQRELREGDRVEYCHVRNGDVRRNGRTGTLNGTSGDYGRVTWDNGQTNPDRPYLVNLRLIEAPQEPTVATFDDAWKPGAVIEFTVTAIQHGDPEVALWDVGCKTFTLGRGFDTGAIRSVAKREGRTAQVTFRATVPAEGMTMSVPAGRSGTTVQVGRQELREYGRDFKIITPAPEPDITVTFTADEAAAVAAALSGAGHGPAVSAARKLALV